MSKSQSNQEIDRGAKSNHDATDASSNNKIESSNALRNEYLSSMNKAPTADLKQESAALRSAGSNLPNLTLHDSSAKDPLSKSPDQRLSGNDSVAGKDPLTKSPDQRLSGNDSGAGKDPPNKSPDQPLSGNDAGKDPMTVSPDLRPKAGAASDSYAAERASLAREMSGKPAYGVSPLEANAAKAQAEQAQPDRSGYKWAGLGPAGTRDYKYLDQGIPAGAGPEGKGLDASIDASKQAGNPKVKDARDAETAYKDYWTGLHDKMAKEKPSAAELKKLDDMAFSFIKKIGDAYPEYRDSARGKRELNRTGVLYAERARAMLGMPGAKAEDF